MLYNAVLISAVKECESARSIYIYIYSLFNLPPNPTHPTSLGCQRAGGRTPCVI